MTETPGTDGPQKRLLTSDDAMRCSTEERERTAAVLSAATGDGRLPLDGTTRRVRIAIVSAVALLIAVMLVLAVVHGIVDDGPEFPGGRD